MIRLVLRSLLPWLLLAAGMALHAQPLLTAPELRALMDEGTVQLVDIREAEAYTLQHVPTAVSAPYGLWHGSSGNPGLVPPMAELTELVRSLGLTPETHAVIVYAGIDATDFGGAARVYWTLRSLGMPKISILNGGLAAWTQEGYAPSDESATARRSDWAPQFNPQWMATREEVLASLGHGRLLVDARPPPYYQGRTAPPQARARGTIPGAVNLDSELLFELGSSEIMDTLDLEDEVDVLGVAPDAPITTFCNAGHWSATDWFVLSELLGYTDVRMYPGSMVDWTNTIEPLPMENEPGRWDTLRFKILDWSNRNLGTKAP